MAALTPDDDGDYTIACSPLPALICVNNRAIASRAIANTACCDQPKSVSFGNLRRRAQSEAAAA
jgi:hypothetical protein